MYGSNSEAGLCLLNGKVQAGRLHATKGQNSSQLKLSASCSLNAPPHAGSAEDVCYMSSDEESACRKITISAHEQEELSSNAQQRS